MSKITFNLIFFILVFIGTIQSQSSNDKAKAYYMEASSAYQSKNYTKTLEYLGKTEEVLGTTNARILNLRIKAYYENKDYTKAKECLDQFSAYSDKASNSLKEETLSYIVKIEETKAKEEEVRQAEIKRKEKENQEEIIRMEIEKELAAGFGMTISEFRDAKENDPTVRLTLAVMEKEIEKEIEKRIKEIENDSIKKE